jgi:hypothetical protein
MKPPNAGKRRPKGVLNKATAAVREAIAAFAEANVEKLQSWLDAIAEKHPEQWTDRCGARPSPRGGTAMPNSRSSPRRVVR